MREGRLYSQEKVNVTFIFNLIYREQVLKSLGPRMEPFKGLPSLLRRDIERKLNSNEH